jgi:hypothetical protein
MGTNGNTEFNKVSPFRSIMELNFSVGGPNGDTLIENTSFTATTHDLVTGERPRSGSTLNPYMPHTVRLKETKDCDVCHTLRDNSGNTINNNLLAGSFGLGTGRYHDLGDWIFASLQGPSPGLLMLDIKGENKLLVNEADAPQKRGDKVAPTQAQIDAAKKLTNNVFPGFNVNNVNDGVNGKLRRVEFDGTQDGAAFVNPRDTALIRNYTAKDHVIRGRDLAFVADGAGGLKIVLVTARDGAQILKTERRAEFPDPDASAETLRKNLGPTIQAVVPTTNAQGVDVVSSDLSDEFVYVADGQAGVKVVFIHEIFTAGPTIVGQVDTPGFANKVRIEGDFLFVADGPAGLTIVDVSNRNNPSIVGTVNTGGNALDVAVYGAFAFIANGNNGMAVVDIRDERNPQFVTTFNPGGVINQARGLAYADNRVYLADGENGLRIIDITLPAQPQLLTTITNGERNNGNDPINDAESVTMAVVPFRTFAMVSDGKNGLRAINVTDFRDIRERLFNSSEFPPNALDNVFDTNFRLTLALRDPLTPFDRANVKVVGNQAAFQITTFPVGENQRLLRIARGRQLDKLADSSGRTLRDSTAVGAGALSRAAMDKMRNVNVVVEPGSADDKGNGLGNIVLQQGGAAHSTRRAGLDSKGSDRRADETGNLTTIAAFFLTAMIGLMISARNRRRSKRSEHPDDGSSNG